MDSGTRDFWEQFYDQRDAVWSGRVNPVLLDVVRPLAPGTALDLGCGEGGDAVWLARQGWRVTAVDVATTALARTAAAAAEAGVADRVTVEQRDLTQGLPDGPFDLVSAQYLQSPIDFPREEVLRRARDVVAPGGLLLVVGHASVPPWARHRHEDDGAGGHGHGDHDHGQAEMPTAQEVLAALQLPPGHWDAERVEQLERAATGPDGQQATLVDAVVAVRRRAGTGSALTPGQ